MTRSAHRRRASAAFAALGAVTLLVAAPSGRQDAPVGRQLLGEAALPAIDRGLAPDAFPTEPIERIRRAELAVDADGEPRGSFDAGSVLVKFRDDTGTNVGDNLASATQWPSSPGTRDYVVTGYTPDGTEFDADAGLAFSATGFDTAGSTLAEVYVAWIKIDWTCGDDAAKSRGFFALKNRVSTAWLPSRSSRRRVCPALTSNR